MVVTDFDGDTKVKTKKDLERRIASIRKGKHGAFILSHNKSGPSLWIHVFKKMAYLHYFPDPDYLIHAGYQATAMTPPGCPKEVRFRVIGGETISMPSETIVSLADAIVAAGEFFKYAALPPSIEWLEL